MNWTDGYRADINYTYGYYSDLNPANMRLCLLMSGIVPPNVTQACELGYGQGVSINIHAAAEPVAWTGTDFNPSQAGLAQEMAKASGADIHCYADSFRDFCERQDLPQFDYIALHGIWSWISRENQEAILNLIKNRLRVGGVLYISYNTYPGWATFHPVAQLMKAYINRQAGANTGILNFFKTARTFMEQLDACGCRYLKNNPSAGERLAKFEEYNQKRPNYVVGELFNTYLEPSYFCDLADLLSEARMTFACSANPVLCVPGVGFSPEQNKLLNEINDPALKETVKDFIFNTQFRKDFFIKGPRRLGIHARNTLLRHEQFVLTTDAAKIPGEFKIQIGSVTVPDSILGIVRTTFGDGRPHSLAEMEKVARELAVKQKVSNEIEEIKFPNLLNALIILIAGNYMAAAQSSTVAAIVRHHTEKLNLFIAEQAIESGNICFMASPITGGGVEVGRFVQLFWLAMRHGATNSAEMANFARECLASAGQSIVDNDKVLKNSEESQAYLQEKANAFITSSLPILKNLQIA